MNEKGPIVQVNSSTIPVAGLGGIGLLAVAAGAPLWCAAPVR